MPVEHHDGLADYPETLPVSLFPTLIDMLRGTMPDPKTGAHLAWHCAGVGLGKWDPHPPLRAGAKPAKPMTREEAATALEAAMPKKGKAASPKGAISIPWARILPLLLAILAEFLPK